MYRIGIGSDIHPLVEGRPLVIGGVTIDSDLGADGYSDADALTHAVCDALLGALALGDLGTHFPDSDKEWEGVDSFVVLAKTFKSVAWHGYEVINIDSTVHLETPKLNPRIDEMRDRFAKALKIDRGQISIKAKTGEGMDAVGERRAVRADAIVLLAKVRT